tara:strand:+ start:4052 stop:6643 length:2592 start_codon:yes stop_codon:yes gene_type:complete
MANGLGQMPGTIFDVMAKTDSQMAYSFQINQQLSQKMHDNAIEHYNQQLDVSNEVYYSGAGQGKEKAFMVDLPALFSDKLQDGPDNSRVMTIDTLNSADALGYFNDIGFTQYMTGKNVFLTGFQPDPENPEMVKPIFAEYDKKGVTKQAQGAPMRLTISRPRNPNNDNEEFSFSIDQIKKLHRDYVYNVRRQKDALLVPSTFDYMTVGKGEYNQAGEVSTTTEKVQKPVEDENLGPEGTGYGGDGDGSKRGWSGEEEWRKQASAFLFDQFNKAPTLPEEIKSIETLIQLEDEKLESIMLNNPALRRANLVGVKRQVAKIRSQLVELEKERPTEEREKKRKFLEDRLERIEGKYNTQFAVAAGADEEKGDLSRRLAGGVGPAVEQATKDLEDRVARVEYQIKTDPQVVELDNKIKDLQFQLDGLEGEALETAEGEIYRYTQERDERANKLREEAKLPEKLVPKEIQGLLDDVINKSAFRADSHNLIIKYLEDDKNLPLTLANKTAIRTLVKGLVNEREGRIEFDRKTDRTADQSPAHKAGNLTGAKGTHHFKSPQAFHAYSNANATDAAFVFMNMIKSDKVSKISGKDVGFLMDTVKFTGTLSAPLLTAVINQKFKPADMKALRDQQKELQPLINKLISPLRETAQLAMEGGVGSPEFTDHMQKFATLNGKLNDNLLIRDVLGNEDHPLNDALGAILQNNIRAGLMPLLVSAGDKITDVEEWFYSFARDDASAAIDPMRVNELSLRAIYNGRQITPKEFANRFVGRPGARTKIEKQGNEGLTGFQLYDMNGAPVGQLIDEEDLSDILKQANVGSNPTSIIRLLETFSNINAVREQKMRQYKEAGSLPFNIGSPLDDTDAISSFE